MSMSLTPLEVSGSGDVIYECDRMSSSCRWRPAFARLLHSSSHQLVHHLLKHTASPRLKEPLQRPHWSVHPRPEKRSGEKALIRVTALHWSSGRSFACVWLQTWTCAGSFWEALGDPAAGGIHHMIQWVWWWSTVLIHIITARKHKSAMIYKSEF